MKRIIIFCQAPADIPFFLTLFEKYKRTYKIDVVVINVEGVYVFLKELNLKFESFIFIKYNIVSFKNPLSLYREKKRIQNIWTNQFKNNIYEKVVFFSRFEDWLTSSFLHLFHKIRKSIVR